MRCFPQFFMENLPLTNAIEKRSSFNWVDYDFFGNQLSLHLVGNQPPRQESTSIDGDLVPAMHYGMILTKDTCQELRDSLASKNIKFIIGPRMRFSGMEGEQGTFFIVDPSGNFLEFKFFTDTSRGLWY